MNNLRNRYIISFVLLAVLVVCGSFYSLYQMNQQQADSVVINIAGRQRMLSQKISKVSLKARDGIDLDELGELRNALELFDTSHNALRFGDEKLAIVANYSNEIDEMYERLDPMYAVIVDAGQSILQKYEEGNEDFSDEISSILAQEDDFLFLMNEIVFAHERLAEFRLNASRFAVYLNALMLLVFILFEWFFIIRPTLKKNVQIDKAKTEFVSLASHQLRTPLTSINWFSQMLIDGDAGKMNKEQLDFMQQISESSERMVALVNDLLNVSRIDLQTFSIAPTDVDIKALARSISDEMKPTIDKKKIDFNLEIATKVNVVKADEKLMRMVMQNLLSNAIKYTPENGKVGFMIDHEQGNLRIRVRDTGVGIPKAQQKKIFSKLFRADNVRGIETEGTGLGLYIVKSVIDNSGGKISFDSVENVGTTFTVIFPPDGMMGRAGEKALK